MYVQIHIKLTFMEFKYTEMNTINDQVYNVNMQIVQLLRGS